MAEGIEVRHRKGCRALRGGRCGCSPTYRAEVWSNVERKKIRRNFATSAEAKSWRADALTALRRGALRSPDPQTVHEAATTWLEAADAGLIRDRSGRPYKPSTLRTYRTKLDTYVLPALGDYRLSELRRHEVQGLVDELLARGLAASSVRNALDPLRAIYRRAMQRDQVAANPTMNLEVPTTRKRRVRIATAVEARSLLEALPVGERAVWATAFYAGLRRGELQALRCESISLGSSEISVERSWDQEAGEIEPKSATSVRTLPLLAILRDYLDEHLLRTGRTGSDLIFGRTPADPFVPTTLAARAGKAWEKAGLTRITPHECRHTFASLLIASGENPKAVQEFMGHSTITMTFDLYGHLFPGSRNEARARMDAYLEAKLAPAHGTTAGQ